MNPPRFLPDEPLPPYAFIPGHAPHPVSDPAGHSHGIPHKTPPTPDPDQWRRSRAYLRGLDLFNHGYYWEAHEAWEGLWHACGRAGTTAEFLQGLIRLAAAGVKLRAGESAGVRSHGAAARDKFVHLTRAGAGRQFGLDAADLARRAAELASGDADSGTALPFLLLPAGGL